MTRRLALAHRNIPRYGGAKGFSSRGSRQPGAGIRTAKESLAYLVMVKETMGDRWLTPDLFRFGASTLANDILMQIGKELTGRYQAAENYSLP
ncbi:MAG: hypothetical protein HY360_00995 [Verrucomicrobia bacterium]|nr:hypothetical protein [Verrucomicrobiota bacterium]